VELSRRLSDGESRQMRLLIMATILQHPAGAILCALVRYLTRRRKLRYTFWGIFFLLLALHKELALMSTELQTRKRGWLPISGRALFFSGLAVAILLIGGFAWLLFQPSSDTTPVGGVGVGQPAPNFTLTDTTGKAVSLDSFRGHPVIINFWATYCAPCRSETPLLQQFYQSHQSDGLVILGVNEGEPVSNMTQYIEEYNVTYPVLSDRTLQFNTDASYNPKLLPRTYFIDAQGIVRAVSNGVLSPESLQRDYQKISG
jgi:cytochrome c biogenesis protein CcmG/thiol:disulfide interchange protein DsbE